MWSADSWLSFIAFKHEVPTVNWEDYSFSKGWGFCHDARIKHHFGSLILNICRCSECIDIFRCADPSQCPGLSICSSTSRTFSFDYQPTTSLHVKTDSTGFCVAYCRIPRHLRRNQRRNTDGTMICIAKLNSCSFVSRNVHNTMKKRYPSLRIQFNDESFHCPIQSASPSTVALSLKERRLPCATPLVLRQGYAVNDRAVSLMSCGTQ
ncbi:hypothetical protein BDZ97DRAFT_1411761 [Flammula alnicola]|nr:hypothetical protein BDZ97DRAFT_1411761 [Flammula alnicola]